MQISHQCQQEVLNKLNGHPVLICKNDLCTGYERDVGRLHSTRGQRRNTVEWAPTAAAAAPVVLAEGPQFEPCWARSRG